MATSGIKKPKKPKKQSQFIANPNQLLKAILKAVGSLKPGEGLEIRRVRDPKYKPPSRPKKKITRRKRAQPVGSIRGK